jgi:hypothetical protein
MKPTRFAKVSNTVRFRLSFYRIPVLFATVFHPFLSEKWATVSVCHRDCAGRQPRRRTPVANRCVAGWFSKPITLPSQSGRLGLQSAPLAPTGSTQSHAAKCCLSWRFCDFRMAFLRWLTAWRPESFQTSRSGPLRFWTLPVSKPAPVGRRPGPVCRASATNWRKRGLGPLE